MNSFDLSQRSQAFETGIFSELSQYKHTKILQGEDLIDLSIGSPDLPPPSFVMESLSTHAKDGGLYGYTLKGLDTFHEAVANYYKRTYQVALDEKKEILQLMGSQDGLVHLPMTIINEGDIVLVPDPGYPAYEAGVKVAGGTMYPMPLLKENHFLPDLNSVPEEIAKKAKLMFLNFPGNPVPALASINFFNDVVTFAKKYQIVVVHDFAYSELVFDNKKAISFLQADGAKEIGVEFHSLSKSYNMAGCRIGYVVGNAQVIQALATLKSNLDYGIFAPVQLAGAAALNEGEGFLERSRGIYQRRRDLLVSGLRELGWDVEAPPGSMFIWAPVPKRYSSVQFVYELIDHAGVIVTPGIAFGKHGEGYVRIALVQEEKVLETAVEKIRNSRLFQ